MRHLQQNAGAITGARVATLRPSVGQILEDLEPLTDDLVRFLALDVDDKADPTRIFFMLRVVQPLLPWKPWKFHHAYLVKKAGFSCWTEALLRGIRDVESHYS
jgi:hypothetical protein